MGKATTVKKHNTKMEDDECRIPGLKESKFMSKENFLRMCRGKYNPPKGNPHGKKKGIPDIECRGCPVGEKIAKGSNVIPVNIIFLGVL